MVIGVQWLRYVKRGPAFVDTSFVNIADKNRRDDSVIASRETGNGNESGRRSVSVKCGSESGNCSNSNSSNNGVRRNVVTTTLGTRGRSGERRSARPCSTTQPPLDTREGSPQTGTNKCRLKKNSTCSVKKPKTVVSRKVALVCCGCVDPIILSLVSCSLLGVGGYAISITLTLPLLGGWYPVPGKGYPGHVRMLYAAPPPHPGQGTVPPPGHDW